MKVTNVNDGKPNSCVAFLKTNLLTILTICGVILGGIAGVIMRETGKQWSDREVMYINFVGDLFLRLLKCLILPLIVSSLISAIAALDISLSGKIAVRAICYYIATTILAVILGIVLVISIQPGKGGNSGNNNNETVTIRNVTTADTLLDLLRNMLPPNLMQACIQQYRTKLIPAAGDIKDWKIEGEYADGTNILGLVVFSSIMGVALAKVGEEGASLKNMFLSLSAVMMRITTWVIWLTPLGVFFLVASKIVELREPEKAITDLGFYFTTVLVGILIHGFVVLPLLFFIITRKSPFNYIINMGQAIATAFGTASSSATLPVTIRSLEKNLNIDPKVTRFVLPIGATINMDGTALYEAVAAIFIAQSKNMDLSIGNLLAISITATAASIGAAGIPQAGLVTMVMVLDTIGLPTDSITMIIAVDWLLDRFRTTINVMGDAFGAGIVNHLSKKELEDDPTQYA